MIPSIRHKMISSLIKFEPTMFYNTSMVGIYDGRDICSCFLNNAECFKKLTFYENFQDSNEESKNSLLELYSEWQKEIPNLDIVIGDGTEKLLYDNLDFLFTDAYNIDYMTYFLNDKFNNTLLAICGYGAEISRTVGISVAIEFKKIYPVMLFNGFLFFTNNEIKYKDVYCKIKKFMITNDIPYVNNLGCIRPNGWYHSLLVDKD